MKTHSLQLWAFALSASTLTCPAITVINGGFETSDTSGWTVISAGDTIVLNGPTPYGDWFLEIGGFGGGVNNSIDQLIGGFTPGECYRVEFATASQWAGGSGAEVEISLLSGSSTPAGYFYAPAVAGWGAWASHTYDFMATSTTVDLQFKQIANGFDDVGIDNISISQITWGEVPEPATTLAGIGCIALAATRWRRK